MVIFGQENADGTPPLGSDVVEKLTGTNFLPDIASNAVTLNSVALVVTQASATSVHVTIPSGCGPLREASLRVTTGGVLGDVFSATVAPDPAGDAIQDVELAVGAQIVYRQPRHCLGLPTSGISPLSRISSPISVGPDHQTSPGPRARRRSARGSTVRSSTRAEDVR